jgi:hypothetical protein
MNVMIFHCQYLIFSCWHTQAHRSPIFIHISKQISVCPCVISMDNKYETNQIYVAAIGPENGSNKRQCFSPLYSVNLCHTKMLLDNYIYTQGLFFSAAYQKIMDVYQKIVPRSSSWSIKRLEREKNTSCHVLSFRDC